MDSKHNLSRRRFMGGTAAALGYLGLKPGSAMGASLPRPPKDLASLQERDDYDSLIKLSSNENPWGPSPALRPVAPLLLASGSQASAGGPGPQ